MCSSNIFIKYENIKKAFDSKYIQAKIKKIIIVFVLAYLSIFPNIIT